MSPRRSSKVTHRGNSARCLPSVGYYASIQESVAGGGASVSSRMSAINVRQKSRRFGAEILVRESQALRELQAAGPRNRTQRFSFYRATLRYAIIITIIIITATMFIVLSSLPVIVGWLGSRVVSVLNSGAEGPGFKSQSRRCRVTVLGKLFTPIVPLFTKQQNWQQHS